MNDLNQCQFIGRLGRDPETRYTADGSPVTNISIACRWKSKNGEGTEWVPVVFFGKLAEIAGQYLTKGSQVFVSGRFNTQSWEKDGQKHYRTQVVADSMQMLGRKSEGSKPRESRDEFPSDDFEDDLPF